VCNDYIHRGDVKCKKFVILTFFLVANRLAGYGCIVNWSVFDLTSFNDI